MNGFARVHWRRSAGFAEILGVLLLAGTLAAQAQQPEEAGPENTATNQTVLSVDVRRNVEGTYIPYRFAFITSGLEKFTFLIPEGYRVDTTDPTKIKLASPDYSGMIIVGVSGSSLPAGVKLEAAALRAKVMAGYPEAVIKEEHSASANEQSAACIDFSWKTESGITRMTRTTFIPTTVGLMEFTLTASPETFEASVRELNLVMLTFRSGTNGKFNYVIGSKLP
jgi:hypothetical protein